MEPRTGCDTTFFMARWVARRYPHHQQGPAWAVVTTASSGDAACAGHAGQPVSAASCCCLGELSLVVNANELPLADLARAWQRLSPPWAGEPPSWALPRGAWAPHVRRGSPLGVGPWGRWPLPWDGPCCPQWRCRAADFLTLQDTRCPPLLLLPGTFITVGQWVGLSTRSPEDPAPTPAPRSHCSVTSQVMGVAQVSATGAASLTQALIPPVFFLV